jgi:hypothetical protein
MNRPTESDNRPGPHAPATEPDRPRSLAIFLGRNRPAPGIFLGGNNAAIFLAWESTQLRGAAARCSAPTRAVPSHIGFNVGASRQHIGTRINKQIKPLRPHPCSRAIFSPLSHYGFIILPRSSTLRPYLFPHKRPIETIGMT